MPAAKKKKTTKRVVHTKAVVHHVPVQKKGHRHSTIFSDNALMLLALFFALVGLLMVLVVKRQNDDFSDYVWKQQWEIQQQNQPTMKKGY